MVAVGGLVGVPVAEPLSSEGWREWREGGLAGRERVDCGRAWEWEDMGGAWMRHGEEGEGEECDWVPRCWMEEC